MGGYMLLSWRRKIEKRVGKLKRTKEEVMKKSEGKKKRMRDTVSAAIIIGSFDCSLPQYNEWN